MNILKNMLLTSLLSIVLLIVFSGCRDSSDEYISISETPTIKNFIANIDTNNTNIALSLGSVEITSQGSSNISSFRLEGRGYSNFSISRYGEITTRSDTTLECTTFKRYDLKVVARNDFGDSNNADVTIQVNCMDEPVLKSLEVVINDYTTGNIGTMEFVRTGMINNNPNIDIKYIEISGENSENFSASNTGSISLSSPLYNFQSMYDLKVRAININDKVGPYVSLRVYINNTNTYTDNELTPINVGTDDYPDNIYDVSYTSLYIYSDSGSYIGDGSMDYIYDSDYIRISLFEEKEISFDLSTDGIYSYGLNNNFIDLYDVNGSFIRGTGNSILQTVLSAGEYYIRVSETSDSYTLVINYDDTSSINDEINTTDTVGNEILTSSYIALNSSYISNLDYLGDRDVFRFDLTYDTNVSIYTSSDIDTYGRLYDDTGLEIISDDDSAGTGSDFKISIDINAGTYYIDVSAYSDNAIGAYGLILEVQ